MSGLARKVLELSEQSGARLVYGVAASATTVYIDGSTVAVTVPTLDSVVMSTDDYVSILTDGADRLVIGTVGADHPIEAQSAGATSSIAVASSSSPGTYFVGTYINFPSVEYDSIIIWNGHWVYITSAGSDNSRWVTSDIATQLNYTGGFTGVTPYHRYTPGTGEDNNAWSATVQYVQTVPAGQDVEGRLYGYYNGAITVTAQQAQTVLQGVRYPQ